MMDIRSGRAGTSALVVMVAAAALASCTRPPVGGGTTTTTGPPAVGRYRSQVFDAVDQVAKDEVFRTAAEAPGLGTASKDLLLNVYVPRGDTAAKRPVVVWQFGGAWFIGDRKQLDAQAQDSARRGFVGVAIDYRITPAGIAQPGMLDAATEDANAAVDWLAARADRFKLDPRAVISGGVSAGAINAIHQVTRAPSPEAVKVAGVVSIAGTSWPGSPAPRAGGPPIIMFSGRSDNIVSYAGQTQFCEQYRAVGNTCVQYSYDGGHGAGFDDAPNKYPPFIYDNVLKPLGY